MIQSAHIIGSKESGGAENFYCRLVNALHDADQKVIAVNPPGSAVSNCINNQIRQIHIAQKSIWGLGSRFRIRQLPKQHDIQIVQTYMGRATRLTHFRRNRQPVHIARLGGYYNLKGYRHAHAWIGNTRGICDYLVQAGLPQDKVFHIGNFCSPAKPISSEDLDTFRSQHNIPGDAFCISSAGRLHPNKGFSDLLSAFSLLPDSIDDRPLHLLIAGDGPLKESLHDQANAAGINARTHWSGWLKDATPVFQAAELFVCPSVHEPLGNVILEAWANKTPVVSTETAGGAELIQHNETGLLTPVSDSRKLAETIKTLLEDEHLRNALAENGHRKLLTNYSEDTIVRQYIQTYEYLLDKN